MVNLINDEVDWVENFSCNSKLDNCQDAISVTLPECQCIDCWRPMKIIFDGSLPDIEDPKELLDLMEAYRKRYRKTLIKEIGKIKKGEFSKDVGPNLYLINLNKEFSKYADIGGLFKEMRKRKAISFLTTNGVDFDIIKKLKKGELPTQITFSNGYQNEKSFEKVHGKNSWKELEKSLKIFKGLNGKTRRVLRFSIVHNHKDYQEYVDMSGVGDSHLKEYISIVKKCEPDFIHVKGVSNFGIFKRINQKGWHKTVKNFSERLGKKIGKLGYDLVGEDEKNGVFIFCKKGKKLKISKF